MGRFVLVPGNDKQAMLGVARRALSPVVDIPLNNVELLDAANEAHLGSLSRDVLRHLLGTGGVTYVQGYLELNADRLTSFTRQLINCLHTSHHCMLIDCLGRVVNPSVLMDWKSVLD